MNFLLHFIYFLIALFIYTHIVSQYKKSHDIKVYASDFENNAQLQTVCDIKQPVAFQYASVSPDFFAQLSPETLASFIGSKTVLVKEVDDYYKDNASRARTSISSLPLALHTFNTLIGTDSRGRYFSENNSHIVDNHSALDALFRQNDENLKPTFTLFTKYDFCMASMGAYTPLRYHTHYRHFVAVHSGRISVKLTPFKSSKHLHPIKDRENNECWSPVNVWTPQDKYSDDFGRVRFVDIDVAPGSVLYVPPYWWYSIRFVEADTLITTTTYNTVMNVAANSIDYAQSMIANTKWGK